MTPSNSILDELRRTGAGMSGELTDMATARLELARLELADSRRQTVGLAKILAACATCLLVAASVLVSLAVIRWHEEIGDARLAIGAAAIIVVALLIGVASYRRFRRDFTGLNESLAELREDAIWVREWLS